MDHAREGEVLGQQMTWTPPTPDDQVKFLRNIQRLLAEGLFTASYKFALLHALADLAVEKGDDTGAPSTWTRGTSPPSSWNSTGGSVGHSKGSSFSRTQKTKPPSSATLPKHSHIAEIHSID